MRKRRYDVGDSLLNKYGERFTIVRWNSSIDILVEFENGEVVKSCSTAINNGRVLNKFSVKVCGVGVSSDWLRKEHSDGREYVMWAGMLKRVYGDDNEPSLHRYKSCRVAEDWLLLENFADWITTRDQWEYPSWVLDKDITQQNLYSESTCFLIPKSINSLITVRGNRARGNELPSGVRKNNNKYIGRYGYKGAMISKSFDTIEEAAIFHNNGRRILLMEEVEVYKDRLDKKCVELLMDFNMENLND